MCGPDEFEADEMLWTPGVDYVGGWRDAKDACGELLSAMWAAGLEMQGVTAVGQAAADGSGVVRLRVPAATVRALAEVVRAVRDGRDARRPAA